MLETTIGGGLPKPAWLAEPEKLWAPWRLTDDALIAGQRDAALVALKEQEMPGIDIVSNGSNCASTSFTEFSNTSRVSISTNASAWASATRPRCRR